MYICTCTWYTVQTVDIDYTDTGNIALIDTKQEGIKLLLDFTM